MKTCKGCLYDLPLSEFYDHPDTADKKRALCKSCYSAKAKEYAKSRPEQYKEWDKARRARNPEKPRARAKVAKALKSGKLIRPSTCPRCGEERKVEAHHHDYEKPLDVTWLCRPCHSEEHRGSKRAPSPIRRKTKVVL